MKVFGSWGRYYDWTKYELPRGSFGAETWCIYYRGLDTLDLGSLNLSNMPGARPVGHAGQLPRPPRAVVRRSIDPDIKPMKQASTSAGPEYQLGAEHGLRRTTSTTTCSRPSRTSASSTRRATRSTSSATPAKASRRSVRRRAPTPLGQPTPRPKRQYDALELGSASASRTTILQRQLHAEPSLRQLRRPRGVGRNHDADHRRTRRRTAQQQAGSISRPGGNANRAWDLDELLLGLARQPRRARPPGRRIVRTS